MDASASDKLLDAEPHFGDELQPANAAGSDKPAAVEDKKASSGTVLLVSFCLMIVVGLGNRILNILQYVPMKNYPLFVNLLTTFAYLPVSLAYVLPMMKYRPDVITAEARSVPQHVWLIMGTLDSIAGVMQSLATAFLSSKGSLIVLLLNSAIPASMLITKVFLKTKYKAYQYLGAMLVIVGIVIVLVPQLSGGSSSSDGTPASTIGVWSAVLILSCVPMCLSSVYKEKALGDTEIDPVYLNYWVAVYQLIISFPLLIPTGLASGVAPADLPTNLLAGLRCYAGTNTVVGGDNPDNCATGPIFVNIYILFNLAYNVLIILLIKYGSSNILWLCITLQVPIANLAFALPFMPNSAPVTWEDGVGLLVIMGGLVIYRFYTPLSELAAGWLGSKRAAAPVALPETAAVEAASADEADDLAVMGASPAADGGATPMQGIGLTHVTRGTRNHVTAPPRGRGGSR